MGPLCVDLAWPSDSRTFFARGTSLVDEEVVRCLESAGVSGWMSEAGTMRSSACPQTDLPDRAGVEKGGGRIDGNLGKAEPEAREHRRRKRRRRAWTDPGRVHWCRLRVDDERAQKGLATERIVTTRRGAPARAGRRVRVRLCSERRTERGGAAATGRTRRAMHKPRIGGPGDRVGHLRHAGRLRNMAQRADRIARGPVRREGPRAGRARGSGGLDGASGLVRRRQAARTAERCRAAGDIERRRAAKGTWS